MQKLPGYDIQSSILDEVIHFILKHYGRNMNKDDIEFIGSLQREVVKDVAKIQTDVSYLKAGQTEIKDMIKNLAH